MLLLLLVVVVVVVVVAAAVRLPRKVLSLVAVAVVYLIWEGLAERRQKRLQHDCTVNDKNSTLVVLLGQVRGAEPSWRSLYRHVLDANCADLALVVDRFNHSQTSLAARARYLWEQPKDTDWSAVYDAKYGAESGKYITSRMEWYDEQTRINGSWSAPIQWWLKAEALRLIKAHGLDSQYERFVFSRSDFVYGCDLLLPMLDPNFIWVPAGEDWGGTYDRHTVLSAKDIDAVDVLHTIFSQRSKKYSPSHYFDNSVAQSLSPEQVWGWHLNEMTSNRVQRYASGQFLVAFPSDHMRVRAGAYKTRLGEMYIKYPDEYARTQATCGKGFIADFKSKSHWSDFKSYWSHHTEGSILQKL